MGYHKLPEYSKLHRMNLVLACGQAREEGTERIRRENEKSTSHGEAKLRPGNTEGDEPVKLSRIWGLSYLCEVCPQQPHAALSSA